MYDIILERAAERSLRKLAVRDFHRVMTAIERLAESPRPHGVKKITGSDSTYRIRVGDFRIMYDIDDAARTVRILRAGHRREVYR